MVDVNLPAGWLERDLAAAWESQRQRDAEAETIASAIPCCTCGVSAAEIARLRALIAISDRAIYRDGGFVAMSSDAAREYLNARAVLGPAEGA